MLQDKLLELIAGEVGDNTAQELAAGMGRLINNGSIPPGTRLPTVRAVAGELGMSPTTVSEAWQALARGGAVETRGRAGSFAGHPDGHILPQRFWQLYPTDRDADALDLSEGVPDPQLLPQLGPIMARLGDEHPTTSYLDDPVWGPLGEHLTTTWPFTPENLTIVDGALDALDRICATLIRIGDRVVVESPGFPPLFDLLELRGAQLVPVAMDEDGVVPDDLDAAMEQDPAAIFLQPRAHNPTGASMTAERTRALAAIIEPGRAMVVEDDHSGDVSLAEPVSIGQYLPERTVHIKSYSKSHGPDLRLAAIGGARTPIAELVTRRRLGPNWTSHLLQHLLHEMLIDPDVTSTVEQAAKTYQERRDLVTSELERRGVSATPGSGINTWITVHNEAAALVNLAARHIGVAPGQPFTVGDTSSAAGAHLRVTTGVVRSDHAELTAHLAEAAMPRV